MKAPPRLRSRPKQRAAPSALLLLTGTLALLLLARLIVLWEVPLPKCGWRALLHLPCPLCGGTRSWAALAQGNFLEAFRLNPLAASACLGAVLWALLSASKRRDPGDSQLDRFYPHPASSPGVSIANEALRDLAQFHRRARFIAWAWIAAALVCLNWIYLCLSS